MTRTPQETTNATSSPMLRHTRGRLARAWPTITPLRSRSASCAAWTVSQEPARHAEHVYIRFLSLLIRQDRCMPSLGARQRGREARYDPASAQTIRISTTMSASLAAKLAVAAKQMNLSVSGMVQELIRRLDVDENGRPVWASETEDSEGRLPLGRSA